MKKLSKTEYEIMEYVWASEEDITMQDCFVHFKDRNWEKRTVSVFLHRLTEKGYLEYKKSGRVYYYHPLIEKKEYGQENRNSKVQMLFGSSMEGVAACFFGKKKLSDKQIGRIREFLDELEKEEE